MRIVILLLLFTAPLLAAESGYRIVHPDGTVEYTDQPIKGAEEIRIPEVPTFPSQSSPQSPRVSSPASPREISTASPKQQNLGYQLLAISSPQEQETVWFNENGMTVLLQLQPGLAEGDELVIRLDGEIVARGSNTSFTLKNVFRGTHTLSAAVIDGQGAVVLEANPVTFYMRQHSVLEPISPLSPPPTPIP